MASILWRLIWVYAVCICSFFECIQLVPHMGTLNCRLATPLANSLDLDQDGQKIDPDLDQNRLIS